MLSGGVALGAFEAGCYAALERTDERLPDWLVGASAGAVNAAIIAGNPPGQREAALRRFWESAAGEPTPVTTFLLGPPPPAGAWRAAYNEAAALQTLLFGRPGLFRPRLASGPRIGVTPALFDLAPLEARLPEVVDFDRLNDGACRVSLVGTDVETGERVVFDTAHGTRLGPRHVVACAALLPVFAPVEVEGRLLGDGGPASNVPLDLVLDAPPDGALECFVVELFARAGRRPRRFGAAMARAADLAFGNQTQRILEGRQREHRLRGLVGQLAARLPEAVRAEPGIAALLAELAEGAPMTLLRIGYHAALDEAGPGKFFDFSPATLADRWAAGEAGMQAALQRLRLPPAAGAGAAAA